MKKFTLVISIFFLLLSSYGQKYVGFMGGGNYSIMQSEVDFYTNDLNSRISFGVGIFAKTNITGSFNINVATEYNNFATHVHSVGFSPSHSREYDYDLNLGYISANVLPEYSVGTKAQVFVQAGPYLAILIHSKMNGALEGYGPTADFTGETLTGSANKYFDAFDAGFIFSTGLRFKLANALFISPRIKYTLGLIDIGEDYFSTYDMSVRIRSIAFSVGIESGL